MRRKTLSELLGRQVRRGRCQDSICGAMSVDGTENIALDLQRLWHALLHPKRVLQGRFEIGVGAAAASATATTKRAKRQAT